MKKHTLGVLTLAVGSLLTACGGGSGSSGVVRDALLDSKPIPRTAKYGQVIAQPKGQSVSIDQLRDASDFSDMKVLTINGRSFELGGVSDNGSVDKHTYNLNHVSYGLIDDYAQGSSRMEYAYYQGNRTINMPSGAAVYQGGLAVSCNQCDNKYHAGTSSFVVDFGKKSLTGSLSALGTTLQVAGEIQGSTFSGNHQDTQISGAFFGDDAQEMAGVFYHENAKTGLEAGGAFGATKQ